MDDDEFTGEDDAGLVDTVVDTVAVPGTADPLEVLYRHHPETILDYAEAIEPLIQVEESPPSGGDKHHNSQPFLSLYEKTKILSFRSNQLAQGARPFITVPEHVTNVLEIAKLELAQRRLPYIIKRPMPDRTFEYWRLSDLMII
jgi:DNA-directed RNA polymerase I, II, and III subunit RPABC2